MTTTNETTKKILNYLFKISVFAWRSNVLPIPLPNGGYRPGSKSGVPDVVGILEGGRFLGIEVKTGKDKLRPIQVSFHKYARDRGALILVVKDFNDFEKQWMSKK